MTNICKKLLCLILAGMMLLGTVSCASSEDENGDGAQEGTNLSTETEGETDLKLDLPEKDFGGSSFRIMGNKTALEHVTADKTKGEEVNDALVESNMWVSNKYNVKFEQIQIDDELDANIVRAYIMAGDDEYDVAYLHDCNSANMSLKGWFLNVYDMPYMDPSNPWWPQFTVESLSLNGKLYHYSNYTSYQAMEWTWGVFFNQEILKDFNQPNPYDYVREGTWTLDTLTKMSTDIYSDNGDGMADTNDLMGFVFTQTPYGWLESFGIEMYKKAGPNSAELSLSTDDEICYTLIDKLHTWFYSGSDAVFVDFYGTDSVGNSMFTDKRLAFTTERIGKLAPLAMEADVEYGIVPMPKIDASQSDYRAGCHDRFFTIPTTVQDKERVGIILEAMSYAGHKFILPAYCEKTLKTRLATDPDCGEMLNMIFEKQVISFAYLFNQQENNTGLQLNLIIKTVEDKNVASFFKTQKKIAEKVQRTITRFYEKE